MASCGIGTQVAHSKPDAKPLELQSLPVLNKVNTLYAPDNLGCTTVMGRIQTQVNQSAQPDTLQIRNL